MKYSDFSKDKLALKVSEDFTSAGILSAEMKFNKRTGEHVVRITTIDGQTSINILTKSGVKETRKVTIPSGSRENRDSIIYELSERGYTQNEVADMMNISQGTVSRVLRGQRK